MEVESFEAFESAFFEEWDTAWSIFRGRPRFFFEGDSTSLFAIVRSMLLILEQKSRSPTK